LQAIASARSFGTGLAGTGGAAWRLSVEKRNAREERAMRAAARWMTVVALAAGGLAPSGAASASDTHLTGIFDEKITSIGCQSGTGLSDPADWGPASGTWRINVGTKTASARFVILLNGQPHVAYTIPLKVTVDDGTTLTAVGTTGAGDLTVSVTGTQMTYTIAPYDSRSFGGDHAAYCPTGSVTYFGTVG
jgi:hypothetical protein